MLISHILQKDSVRWHKCKNAKMNCFYLQNCYYPSFFESKLGTFIKVTLFFAGCTNGPKIYIKLMNFKNRKNRAFPRPEALCADVISWRPLETLESSLYSFLMQLILSISLLSIIEGRPNIGETEFHAMLLRSLSVSCIRSRISFVRSVLL